VTEFLDQLMTWAWTRHQNELSWYVRPLFLLPLAWAAHRRSGWGIGLTVLALLSSMAWFPAPEVPDPRVLEFLAFEQQWLAGPWPLSKVLLSLLVPLSLGAYCAAFWRRSWAWGVAVLAAMAVGKVLWAVLSGEGGSAVVVPASVGLGLGVLGVLAARLAARHRSGPTPTPSG
jgi:hypothetical protein